MRSGRSWEALVPRASEGLTPGSRSHGASPPSIGRGCLVPRDHRGTSSRQGRAYPSPNTAWHTQQTAVPAVCPHARDTHMHPPRTQAPQCGRLGFRCQLTFLSLSFPICKMGNTTSPKGLLGELEGCPQGSSTRGASSSLRSGKAALAVILVMAPPTQYPEDGTSEELEQGQEDRIVACAREREPQGRSAKAGPSPSRAQKQGQDSGN